MEPKQKKTLRGLVLEVRALLEGERSAETGERSGDLERRLLGIGIRRDRDPRPVDELPQLSDADRRARGVADAYLAHRLEAGIERRNAVDELVRETAYTWTNRLLALRCMEARELIDPEVILQKPVYAGRSLAHHRLVQRNPALSAGEDDGLFAVLEAAFEEQAAYLPRLFDPMAPGAALRPSTGALKRILALLSGTQAPKGQDPASGDLFRAPDALGWAYQFYQEAEKARVDSLLKTKKGFKCEGADIAPKTALYTEPYMVKFLVQNSLGATWALMHPETKLAAGWEYYVKDADRAPVERKPVSEITFLDPACGSGHFLVEAFDLFYAMYEEEGAIAVPAIAASILERNLFGIDIDARAVEIAEAALWMRAAERAPGFRGAPAHLVATNLRLPRDREHVKEFLAKHPEDAALEPALRVIFEQLEHADELGSLFKIEEPVEAALKEIREENPVLVASRDWEEWKRGVLGRLRDHFAAEAEAPDLVQAYFGRDAGWGIELLDVLAGRYDVVAANPPYLGSKAMGPLLKEHLERHHAPGKRDLYAAFILRCLSLARERGRIAMVTQQSWMFLGSFAALRAAEAPDEQEGVGGADGRGQRKKRKPTEEPEFRGILREAAIETLAHLGPRAFTEITGEVVNVALVVARRGVPDEAHRLTAFRLVGPKSPDEKEALLREAIRSFGRKIGQEIEAHATSTERLV